jgi:hypothetical protein
VIVLLEGRCFRRRQAYGGQVQHLWSLEVLHRPKGENRTAQGFSPGKAYPVNRPERASECDGLSTWIAKYSFSPVAFGRPLQGDLDGALPGLKAWAVLLNRLAVRSNRLAYKDRDKIKTSDFILQLLTS